MVVVINVPNVIAPLVKLEIATAKPYQTIIFNPEGIIELKLFKIPSGTTSGIRIIQLWSTAYFVIRTDNKPIKIAQKIPFAPKALTFKERMVAPASVVVDISGEQTRIKHTIDVNPDWIVAFTPKRFA